MSIVTSRGTLALWPIGMKKPGGPKPSGFVWSMFDNSLEIYVQASGEGPDRVYRLAGIDTETTTNRCSVADRWQEPSMGIAQGCNTGNKRHVEARKLEPFARLPECGSQVHGQTFKQLPIDTRGEFVSEVVVRNVRSKTTANPPVLRSAPALNIDTEHL